MPYLRQRSLTGIPASASFKIATIWLSVMRLLIVKLLCFSLKEILRVGCIILRGSYTSKPNGLQVRDPRVFSAGKQMFDQLINKGVEPDLALTISRELLESGVTEPIAITMKSGDTLYKVVPKNSGKPSDNSPYFIDKKAFDSLPSDTNEIGNHLGLPQIPEEFDIYSITAKSESVIYQSEIAPFIVNNGEHIRSGGGVQTLVPDRSVFTSPKLVE